MATKKKPKPEEKERYWTLDTIKKQQQIVDHAKTLPGGSIHSNHVLACWKLFFVSYSHESMTEVRDYMSYLGGKAKRKEKHLSVQLPTASVEIPTASVQLPTTDEWLAELASDCSRQHFLHPEDQKELIEAFGVG